MGHIGRIFENDMIKKKSIGKNFLKMKIVIFHQKYNKTWLKKSDVSIMTIF